MVTKASAAKKANIPVDSNCPLGGASVHEDYDCMLNQTNIGANNNKFYVIQLLEKGGKYYCWTRWGRVGEDGQNALIGPSDFAKALKAFQSKFKDKTKNAWEDRADFKPAAGRYTLIEIDRSVDADKAEEIEEKLKGIDAEAAKVQKKTAKKFADCKLDKPVEQFMNLIFDEDMFKGAMASFDIDVKKMPLGQLSKTQVEKGFEVLEELEEAIEKKKTKAIEQVTSRFYTVIPHAFGRRVPPIIDTMELLQKKFDMLNVLGDIEIAVSVQKSDAATSSTLPHPMDEKYAALDANLEWVDETSREYDFVSKYLEATARAGRKPKLVNLFRLDRKPERKRFAEHDKLGNRKLLWHGTNVAVVA